MKKQPIGIFDSGYGGLSILKNIVKELPEYDYLYLGDNARSPYGTRSFSTVYNYTLECVKWLFNQQCSLVIIACNTASAKALRSIQQKDLPALGPGKRVLGVIRPTSEVIGKFTNTGHIGILGTTGTVQSESYLIEIEKFFPAIKISQEACPIWVSLVEDNKYDSPEADIFVQNHINNLLQKDKNIDTILLACTHYPLLLNKIRKATPSSVSIISQGEIVAKSLKEYLNNHPEIAANCSKNGMQNFYTTGDAEKFNKHGSIFFGQEIEAKKLVLP